MENKQALDNIKEIFNQVAKTDDQIIKSAESLKVVLLNLKIEQFRIKQTTGISPIVEKLASEINNIEQTIKDLIGNNRQLLNESIEKLEEIVNE